MFHPWRALRGLTDVTLHWTREPGLLGATDGLTVIYMHPDQSQRQRRSTLTHELAHITLGHTQGCNPHDERAADLLAAHWLIPIDRLIEALRWSDQLEEIAEELWVDLATLRTRLTRLTCDEKLVIKYALGED